MYMWECFLIDFYKSIRVYNYKGKRVLQKSVNYNFGFFHYLETISAFFPNENLLFTVYECHRSPQDFPWKIRDIFSTFPFQFSRHSSENLRNIYSSLCTPLINNWLYKIKGCFYRPNHITFLILGLAKP